MTESSLPISASMQAGSPSLSHSWSGEGACHGPDHMRRGAVELM